MENYWIERAELKAQVRAELEEEYKQKLQQVKEEMERALEEGYEEAYQMLLTERLKADQLEVDLYEEYDKRLHDCREYIIDKVDAFLDLEWKKLCEAGQDEYAAKLAGWRKAISPREMVDISIGAAVQESYEQVIASRRHLEAKTMRQGVQIAKLEATVRKLKAGDKNDDNP